MLGSPLECRSPRPCPLPAGRRKALLGFRSLPHMPTTGIRFSRGLHAPGTFRPQGLSTLPAVCSPRGLARPVDRAARMGFALQGLAPPGQRYPSRGLASLVLSPPGPKAGRPRLQRIAPAGKGSGPPRPEGRDVRTLPSWDSAPPRRSHPPPSDRLPGPSPSYPFGRKCSLRSTSGRGSRGFACGGSGWPLSRLPAFLGFCTFPSTGAS
jgi:hypothetical protein